MNFISEIFITVNRNILIYKKYEKINWFCHGQINYTKYMLRSHEHHIRPLAAFGITTVTEVCTRVAVILLLQKSYERLVYTPTLHLYISGMYLIMQANFSKNVVTNFRTV